MHHLQVGHHVIGARLQVDAADGNVLATGPVAGQVHRHQVVQATPCGGGGGGKGLGDCQYPEAPQTSAVTSFTFLREPTNDGQELVGAAVGEETAHVVLGGEGLGEGLGEGRHTLPAVLIGLQRRRETRVKNMSWLTIATPAVSNKNSGGLVVVVVVLAC